MAIGGVWPRFGESSQFRLGCEISSFRAPAAVPTSGSKRRRSCAASSLVPGVNWRAWRKMSLPGRGPWRSCSRRPRNEGDKCLDRHRKLEWLSWHAPDARGSRHAVAKFDASSPCHAGTDVTT